jgi:hypothetical protein
MAACMSRKNRRGIYIKGTQGERLCKGQTQPTDVITRDPIEASRSNPGVVKGINCRYIQHKGRVRNGEMEITEFGEEIGKQGVWLNFGRYGRQGSL